MRRTQDVPEQAIVSMRVGGVRRQAALSCGRPFRFPSGIAQENLLKVDILSRIGSGYVVLKPNETSYAVVLSEGCSMECEVDVTQLEEGASVAPAPENDMLKDVCGAKETKEYMESTGVLRFVQGLLQMLIKERPKDPYAFMARHLHADPASALEVVKTRGMEDPLKEDASEPHGKEAPPKGPALEEAELERANEKVATEQQHKDKQGQETKDATDEKSRTALCAPDDEQAGASAPRKDMAEDPKVAAAPPAEAPVEAKMDEPNEESRSEEPKAKTKAEEPKEEEATAEEANEEAEAEQPKEETKVEEPEEAKAEKSMEEAKADEPKESAKAEEPKEEAEEPKEEATAGEPNEEAKAEEAKAEDVNA